MGRTEKRRGQKGEVNQEGKAVVEEREDEEGKEPGGSKRGLGERGEGGAGEVRGKWGARGSKWGSGQQVGHGVNRKEKEEKEDKANKEGKGNNGMSREGREGGGGESMKRVDGGREQV